MMPSNLRVQLLGGMSLSWDGRSLGPLESSRSGSLLAYLLLNPSLQLRPHLAFVLWPDSTEEQALTNLRHQLHFLRRALPDPDRFLEVTRRTLRWREDAPYWLDVAVLEAAWASLGAGHGPETLLALGEAVDLYRGDLLEGSYDEWLVPHRDRARRVYLDLLEGLSSLAEQSGRVGEAIAATERLIQQDPLREESYRSLMRLHFDNGDRAKALRTYHACSATLERELGVEPSVSTRQAYEGLVGPADLPGVQMAPQRSKASGAGQLIGRSSEWQALVTAWQELAQGRQRLLLVTGEAGIGKTRLVEEFRAWLAHRRVVTATARSYPAEGSLAFGLVTSWLRSEEYAGYLRNLDPQQSSELARLLPELRQDVFFSEGGDSVPGEDQLRLFDAVARVLLAVRTPLLLVAEDLHWADRQSLQFLHYLLRLETGASMLVIGTARNEDVDYRHPLNNLLASLRAQGHLVEIELDRLSAADTSALAEQVVGHPLDPSKNDLVFSESEGNPLFIVEALRAGLPDIEPGRPEQRQLSPKVQAVIELRLAQLSDQGSALLAVAAVIGREFSIELLERASDAGQEELVAALDELWRRRLIREQGAVSYDFSHDKIREVVYQGLSPMVRRHHHRAIAAVLETMHSRRPEVSYQIATHYDRAGGPELAVGWYELAAGDALGAHAAEEGLRLLDRGLELLAAQPRSRERDERELSLLLASLAPRLLLEGSVSARLRAAQERALSLEHSLGAEPAAPLLRSAAITSLSLADFDEARRIGSLLLGRGERQHDDVLIVEGEYLLGISAFWKGELHPARTHFELAVEHYRPEHHFTHRVRYGLDPKVICLSRLGNTLWFLGLPESAQRTKEQALATARELGHLPSLATATVFATFLALEQRDEVAIRGYVAALAASGLVESSLANRVSAAALAGFVDVLEGRPHIGIGTIRRALEESHQYQHAPGLSASMIRLLLEAESVAGEIDAGLQTTESALAFPDGVHLWESEIRRLRACFLSLSGAPSFEVEVELKRAIAVAEHQSATLLVVRSAASLLEHRMQQGGDLPAARSLLEETIGSLAEGRNCPEVVRASSLLAKV
jgi:DNA-binding SARP family transcriptional activator